MRGFKDFALLLGFNRSQRLAARLAFSRDLLVGRIQETGPLSSADPRAFRLATILPVPCSGVEVGHKPSTALSLSPVN